MQHLKLAVFVLGVLLVETAFSQVCIPTRPKAGKIVFSARAIRRGRTSTRCWNVGVPMGNTAKINVTRLTSDRSSGVSVQLKVNGQELRPLIEASSNRVIMQTSDVTIEHTVENFDSLFPVTSIFELTYTVGSPNEGVQGLREGRERAIQWLKNQRFDSGGWRKETHKAIIALHLATGTNRGRNAEEEAWFNEIRTALSSVLIEENDPAKMTPEIELALYTNALLAACIDPKDFSTKNIVAALTGKKAAVVPATAALLALCNAGEELVEADETALKAVLAKNPQSITAEEKEPMAYAIMAYACERKRSIAKGEDLEDEVLKSIDKAVQRMMRLQRGDGRFDDARITALYSQAIISWGKISATEWSFAKAAQYLTKEVSSDHLDLDAVFLALPVLNAKSMADISCAGVLESPRGDIELLKNY